MMKSKNAIRSFILAGLSITALSSEPVWAVPLISVEPTSQSVATGSIISVQIVVSDVVDLYAYQFDLTFDPTVLAVTSLTEGAFLATGGTTFFVPGTIDNSLGSISLTANTLLGPVPGVNGSGSLTLVQFSALADGTSPVELSNVALLDSALADIQANTVNGQITVQDTTTDIPEPASLWLVAVGVICSGMYRCPKYPKTDK